MSVNTDFWTHEHDLPDGCLLWKCGSLSLYIKRRYDDWMTLSQWSEEPTDEFSAQSIDEMDGQDWSRWAFTNPPDAFRVLPSMPDLPVVVRPRFPIILPPGVQAHFFVPIPLWAQVMIGVKDYMLPIKPIPMLNLSKTWFGNHLEGEGELCYSLRTIAVRDYARAEMAPYRAICPVKIMNQSAATLHFDKICLRVQYLNIYRDKNSLWTNPVYIKSTKKNDLGDIKYGRKSPEQAESPELIANAIKLPPQGFVERTFGLSSFKPFIL